ncbi:DUF4259 domain-containing protein [Sandaracinus amylolyticus]|uniref:DUF4259 domain-containing protein n=1 Tax=Sandaracinus amylolyticus TaxID=927083 RepID=A0A0F6W0G7_9BACT|nr:DUF4259 domain-containing protein [Sandaracinus amylolyticus]AKF04273.1 hypothetical protein DB32_001422 [Sandaracinus amylolyticus]
MGAWGHGTFENDQALEWLADLVEGSASIRTTLEAVTDDADVVDSDVSSGALAAAEVVAAWRDRDLRRLPDAAREWLEANPRALDASDVTLAARAIPVVLDAQRSELAQLWDEGDSDAWRADVGLLLGRLSAAGTG